MTSTHCPRLEHKSGDLQWIGRHSVNAKSKNTTYNNFKIQKNKKKDPGCARVKPNEPHLPMATQGPYGLHQPRMATFKGNLEPSCDGKKSIQKCKLVHQSKGLPLLWTSSPLSQHGSKKNSSFILPSIHPSSHPAIDQSVNRSLNLECTVSFKANPHSTLICKF